MGARALGRSRPSMRRDLEAEACAVKASTARKPPHGPPVRSSFSRGASATSSGCWVDVRRVASGACRRRLPANAREPAQVAVVAHSRARCAPARAPPDERRSRVRARAHLVEDAPAHVEVADGRLDDHTRRLVQPARTGASAPSTGKGRMMPSLLPGHGRPGIPTTYGSKVISTSAWRARIRGAWVVLLV